MVGAGWIAKDHAAALTRFEGVELAAVCDLQRARAERLAPPGARVYERWEDLLERERLDALWVCVETAAVRDRVEVRAEEERRCFGGGRGENGRVVSGSVDPGLETSHYRSFEKPGTSSEMGIAEGRPVHTAFGRAADRGQCVEVRAEPIRVDLQRAYSAPARSGSGPLASVSTAQSVPVRCDASMSAERVAVT